MKVFTYIFLTVCVFLSKSRFSLETSGVSWKEIPLFFLGGSRIKKVFRDFPITPSHCLCINQLHVTGAYFSYHTPVTHILDLWRQCDSRAIFLSRITHWNTISMTVWQEKCQKTFFVYANDKIHRQIMLLSRLFFDVSYYSIITISRLIFDIVS